jgi:TDG/mug DNA glycosylase family protein
MEPQPALSKGVDFPDQPTVEAPNSTMPPRKQATPDILAPGLEALFVGINPGLLSARVGHNFANPANGFWRLMHESGLVPRRLAPTEEMELLRHGLGLTNLVARETRGVMDLSRDEFEAGKEVLAAKIRKYRPAAVVFVGVTVYRAFAGKKPAATIACGEQPERIEGARVFVVPNPSGRNAHFSYAQMLEHFRTVARALGRA